jgi:antitoxin ParD1/3/4
MRNTKPLSITVPHEMARMIKEKVTSGQYASESEVIREGLRALLERDAAVERWLRDEVSRRITEVAESPNAVIPIEDVLARVKADARKSAA